jgi:hypothetical protein
MIDRAAIADQQTFSKLELAPYLLKDRRNSQQEATDGAACEESSLAGGTQNNSFLHRFRLFSALTIITCRNKNNNKILDSFIRFFSLQFDPIKNHFVGTKTAILGLDRFRLFRVASVQSSLL